MRGGKESETDVCDAAADSAAAVRAVEASSICAASVVAGARLQFTKSDSGKKGDRTGDSRREELLL